MSIQRFKGASTNLQILYVVVFTFTSPLVSVGLLRFISRKTAEFLPFYYVALCSFGQFLTAVGYVLYTTFWNPLVRKHVLLSWGDYVVLFFPHCAYQFLMMQGVSRLSTTSVVVLSSVDYVFSNAIGFTLLSRPVVFGQLFTIVIMMMACVAYFIAYFDGQLGSRQLTISVPDSETLTGVGLLVAARLCYVLRGFASKLLLFRRAGLKDSAPQPQLVSSLEADDEGATAMTALLPGEQGREDSADEDGAPKEGDDVERLLVRPHIFSSHEPHVLARLDVVFTNPLYDTKVVGTDSMTSLEMHVLLGAALFPTSLLVSLAVGETTSVLGFLSVLDASSVSDVGAIVSSAWLVFAATLNAFFLAKLVLEVPATQYTLAEAASVVLAAAGAASMLPSDKDSPSAPPFGVVQFVAIFMYVCSIVWFRMSLDYATAMSRARMATHILSLKLPQVSKVDMHTLAVVGQSMGTQAFRTLLLDTAIASVKGDGGAVLHGRHDFATPPSAVANVFNHDYASLRLTSERFGLNNRKSSKIRPMQSENTVNSSKGEPHMVAQNSNYLAPVASGRKSRRSTGTE